MTHVVTHVAALQSVVLDVVNVQIDLGVILQSVVLDVVNVQIELGLMPSPQERRQFEFHVVFVTSGRLLSCLAGSMWISWLRRCSRLAGLRRGIALISSLNK